VCANTAFVLDRPLSGGDGARHGCAWLGEKRVVANRSIGG
jgi:hypothetical protein